jgi:pSer/pThr/pTyr-binding forkhead associated (FHA) protein
MRAWVIGGGADCDLVVDSPVVSARHCRLTQTDDGYYVEDLNSTNGTHVNGIPITSKRRVMPGEKITLGKAVVMPWPAEVVRYLRIGRDTDNDIVLDDPRVSLHHARLMTIVGLGTLIEDVGSSNGTFLNSVDRRVVDPTPVTESDTLYLGALAVPARPIFRERIALHPPIPSPPPARPQEVRKPASREPTGGPKTRTLWIGVLLAQAPILALGIILVFGRYAATDISASGWPAVAQSVASTSAALALAAIWLGCSNVLPELDVAPRSTRRQKLTSLEFLSDLSRKLLFLWALGALQCAVMLMIVHWGCRFRGSWLAMYVLLVLAMTVGVLLGWIISRLIPTGATAAAALLASFLLMLVLSGSVVPLPRMNPALREAAAAIPARWAFEGLLVLEADASPTHRPSTRDLDAVPIDMAEIYFPAETDRMGPGAAALALVAILIALAGATGGVLLRTRITEPPVRHR